MGHLKTKSLQTVISPIFKPKKLEKKIRCYDEFLSRFLFFHFLVYHKLNFKPFDKMFSLSKGDCKSPSVCRCVHPALSENVSEAIVWRFFQCLLQKMVGWVAFEIFLHYTRKFLAFDNCFLSQCLTANFFLRLLLFSPCLWKVISVDRLIK